MMMFTALRRWFREPLPLTRLEAYHELLGTQSTPTPPLKARTRTRLHLVTTRRIERKLEKARKRA